MQMLQTAALSTAVNHWPLEALSRVQFSAKIIMSKTRTRKHGATRRILLPHSRRCRRSRLKLDLTSTSSIAPQCVCASIKVNVHTTEVALVLTAF